MKPLTFSCLICALNLYFAQKLLRRAKFARGCSEETLCGSILVSDHSVFAFWVVAYGRFLLYWHRSYLLLPVSDYGLYSSYAGYVVMKPLMDKFKTWKVDFAILGKRKFSAAVYQCPKALDYVVDNSLSLFMDQFSFPNHEWRQSASFLLPFLLHSWDCKNSSGRSFLYRTVLLATVVCSASSWKTQNS